jgi:predicted ATP-grasp superfamily ATP-dependent carboligase
MISKINEWTSVRTRASSRSRKSILVVGTTGKGGFGFCSLVWQTAACLNQAGEVVLQDFSGNRWLCDKVF